MKIEVSLKLGEFYICFQLKVHFEVLIASNFVTFNELHEILIFYFNKVSVHLALIVLVRLLL